MKYIVYINSGTTNSRLYLLGKGGVLSGFCERELGSRDSAIAGTNQVLIDGLYELYIKLLNDAGIADIDVSMIYASGLVTSPYGLHEVPHVTIPITFEAFARTLVPFREDRRFKREIWLVPGIKTNGKDITGMNNARGEEIEVLGVMQKAGAVPAAGEAAAVMLPGSHTHTLLVRDGSICDLLSSFTGELYAAIQKETIMAPILNTFPDHYDEDMIRMGVENLRRYGFNRALYMGHGMRMLNYGSDRQRVSYCEGVILGGLCQALEETCRLKWTDVKELFIVTGHSTAQLYSTVLSCCQAPFRVTALISDQAWVPSLEGLKYILKIRKEMI